MTAWWVAYLVVLVAPAVVAGVELVAGVGRIAGGAVITAAGIGLYVWAVIAGRRSRRVFLVLDHQDHEADADA